MSESGKITASHLSRAAVIYVRQSTLAQVERNTESTMRQYDLAGRASQLGRPREAIRVVDSDLGISGSVTGQRAGVEGMVAEVALGQVGGILALERSRLARDEAVTGVIAAVFEQFAVSGSVRATWLWLRAQGLRWPLQQAVYLHGKPGEITWVEPTYHAVHTTLTHPAYAGAYVYGRTRDEHCLGPDGALRTRRRKLSRDQWEVLIPDHHPGFTDWDTYLANQARIGSNIRPQASQPGTGAVREGSALLQGLATCGTCGRKLAVYYEGKHKATPGYYCTGTGNMVEGRGTRHLRAGGVAIDAAVTAAFLAALEPVPLQACLQAARQLEDDHDAVLDQYRRQVEQARYHAGRAERRS